MLLEKLQEHKNFTAHEKDVAEYILSHLDQISEVCFGMKRIIQKRKMSKFGPLFQKAAVLFHDF